MATKPGQRKLQILQALASMLEQPKGEKITTAALAARLSVSEAALYRHFASKAQMYEGLIEFIESSVFGLINQIAEREEDGVHQAHAILQMLLSFASNNPGMTRVLIGDALVGEDERLQQRMNGFYDRVELALKGALRQAAADAAGASSPDSDQERDNGARASLMVAFVVGRWHRYAKSGFALTPAQDANAQIALLLR
jgi:TetR/AcrR family transcriptional regulator